METPNQSSKDVSKSPATATRTAVDTPMQPSEQLPKPPAIDESRALPNRRRALSVSGADGVVRDISPLSTWLTTETRVRDFVNASPASPSAPKISNATMQRLAQNKRLAIRKKIAASALDSAGIPKNDSARHNVVNGKPPAIRKYTGLPPNLTPSYCGRHPIPYTMPDRKTLSKIFHPLLVELILTSNYPQIAPNRCFCSLVLHELQIREARYWLDIYGPSSHTDLQFQFRTMLTSDERMVSRILWHYGDALRMNVHAKRNGRPMKYDSWAEYVSLLCEEIFTCGPHPLLTDCHEPTENPTKEANNDATEERKAPVKVSKNVAVHDLVGEAVRVSVEKDIQDPIKETVAKAADHSVRETVRELVREVVRETVDQTVREAVREMVGETVRETIEDIGAELNNQRPAEETNGTRKKGSLRKSLFQGMRKMAGLKKREATASTGQR